MKLITTIAPRRDKTVIVTSLDGRKKFVFADDGTNQLAADVDDDATVAHLLRSESFYPAEESDFAEAMKLAQPAAALDGDAAAGGSDDDNDDDADADEGSPDGGPVEAGTQPVVATPAAVRRARAR